MNEAGEIIDKKNGLDDEVRFTCIGERGECGEIHLTYEEAVQCNKDYDMLCRQFGGSSDRKIVEIRKKSYTVSCPFMGYTEDFMAWSDIQATSMSVDMIKKKIDKMSDSSNAEKEFVFSVICDGEVIKVRKVSIKLVRSIAITDADYVGDQK